MRKFAEAVNEELVDLRAVLSKINGFLRAKRLMYGFVNKVHEKDSDEWKAFGRGSIEVIIPDLQSSPMIARPATLYVNPPKEDAFVLVQSSGMQIGDFVYWGHYVFPKELPGIEEIIKRDLIDYDYGFVDGAVPYRYGGHRLEDVDDNPGQSVIVDSRTNWIIGAREVEQELDMSVDEGWRAVIAAGDGGEVYIGARNPQLETESVASGASVNVKIDGGVSGSVEVKTGSATTESMILGETLKAKLEALIDEINAITVNTPLGPSSTPNNSANFNTLKSELTEILSTYNKNN